MWIFLRLCAPPRPPFSALLSSVLWPSEYPAWLAQSIWTPPTLSSTSCLYAEPAWIFCLISWLSSQTFMFQLFPIFVFWTSAYIPDVLAFIHIVPFCLRGCHSPYARLVLTCSLLVGRRYLVYLTPIPHWIIGSSSLTLVALFFFLWSSYHIDFFN